MANDLIINNHIISKDIKAILEEVKSELTNGKLNHIKYSNDEVQITCPFHNNGLEKRPSCFIYVGDDDKVSWGTFHCFTCNERGPLYHFIAECFDESDSFGKSWLIHHFTERIINSEFDNLKPIILNKEVKKEKKYLDESILDNYQSFHPYMLKRKLSLDICNKFEVKYDPESECLVFPVRDENKKLLFLTRRSVNNKKFIIDSNVEKPIYLLYDVLEKNAKTVYVCESQINALTLQSWGYDAIATFGCNVTEYQFDILNKTNIIHYVLCFDGDRAGKEGTDNFKRRIRKDVFVDVVKIPDGKDVNDLTKEEFENLCLHL